MICLCPHLKLLYLFFFFNDTATTEIYTLSLHDALPISSSMPTRALSGDLRRPSTRCANGRAPKSSTRLRRTRTGTHSAAHQDRKSTRLNSSHSQISYAVFCLKKKKYLTNARHRIQYSHY